MLEVSERQASDLAGGSMRRIRREDFLFLKEGRVGLIASKVKC
jgi:hypothetical protein